MPKASQSPILLLPGVLGVLFPGAGQMFRGEVRRGFYAALGVLGLFFGGILIGGIDVVDSQEDRIWFIGQAFVGPIALGVDSIHQKYFKAFDPQRKKLRSGHPNERRVVESSGRAVWQTLTPDELASGQGPPNIKSVSRINEIGTLYCTIAGMLNLIVILDAFVPHRYKEEDESPAIQDGSTPDA